ncbi:MAG: GTPase Era [Deltaproteobacteria bacterium]|nr:GTPase Era [Deltaproteobacteria bacterium]
MSAIARAGTCAIVGAANVGKSTFLNAVVGQKVAIASPVPQTTRRRILGLVRRGDTEIALLDTPGLHRHRGRLNQRLMRVARATLSGADAVILMVDASRRGGWLDPETDRILRPIAASARPCLLVLNKIDLIAKPRLLPMLAAAGQRHAFAALVPISARQRDGVDRVLDAVAELMPAGGSLYGPDAFTDQSERDLCAELIREQVLRRTRQEIPHSAAVTIERFDESRRTGDRPLVEIEATIWVEREGQKAIAIGAGGNLVKAIGSSARTEIERLLESRVMLRLEVEVASGWTDDPAALDRLGLKP